MSSLRSGFPYSGSWGSRWMRLTATGASEWALYPGAGTGKEDLQFISVSWKHIFVQHELVKTWLLWRLFLTESHLMGVSQRNSRMRKAREALRFRNKLSSFSEWAGRVRAWSRTAELPGLEPQLCHLLLFCVPELNFSGLWFPHF